MSLGAGTGKMLTTIYPCTNMDIFSRLISGVVSSGLLMIIGVYLELSHPSLFVLALIGFFLGFLTDFFCMLFGIVSDVLDDSN